jgi:hypothetical protein
MLAVGTSCGESAAEMPAADQRAIFEGFVRDARPLFRQDCRSVRAPVSDGTLDAYATLLRIARRDPRAILQSPDSVDLRWSTREYVAQRAADITFCMDRSPSADASWQRLKTRLDREVVAMATGGERAGDAGSPAVSRLEPALGRRDLGRGVGVDRDEAGRGAVLVRPTAPP